jgi:hypothetical protein
LPLRSRDRRRTGALHRPYEGTCYKVRGNVACYDQTDAEHTSETTVYAYHREAKTKTVMPGLDPGISLQAAPRSRAGPQCRGSSAAKTDVSDETLYGRARIRQ